MSDDESPGVSEGELAMKKRREKAAGDSAGLEDADKELLENNRVERSHMDDEIRELRDRNEKRKKEREIEEKRLAAERAADDARRKADEEERKRKKGEEEEKKKSQRAQKMAEFEKWKNPSKANFVISKRAAAEGGEAEEQGEDEDKGKKSKEQLEAEKQAILRQRLKPLDIDGADNAKLTEKAKELHTLYARLEGEKYDLDKRLHYMQQELVSLAERARQANKVGKEGSVRRVNEDADKLLARFAGAPSKVEMYSKYERQKDKRSYGDRKVLFTGPLRKGPAERIAPHRIVKWSEEGLPEYVEAGAPPPQQEQEAAA